MCAESVSNYTAQRDHRQDTVIMSLDRPDAWRILMDQIGAEIGRPIEGFVVAIAVRHGDTVPALHSGDRNIGAAGS